jgi:hypothetical protein
MSENCVYSVPLNGQNSVPAVGEYFQFSEKDCSLVGTTTNDVNVDFTQIMFASGFAFALASMFFIIWLFKK